MTRRERLLAALRLEKTDRVPMFDFLFQEPMYQELIGRKPGVYNALDAMECALALEHVKSWFTRSCCVVLCFWATPGSLLVPGPPFFPEVFVLQSPTIPMAESTDLNMKLLLSIIWFYYNKVGNLHPTVEKNTLFRERRILLFWFLQHNYTQVKARTQGLLPLLYLTLRPNLPLQGTKIVVILFL